MERMGTRRRFVFLQAVVLGARMIAEGSARRTGERRMGGGGNDIVQRGRDHGSSSSSIGRDGLGMAVLLTLGVLASQRRLSRLVGGELLTLLWWWRRGFVELDSVSLVLATKGPNGHGDG